MIRAPARAKLSVSTIAEVGAEAQPGVFADTIHTTKRTDPRNNSLAISQANQIAK